MNLLRDKDTNQSGIFQLLFQEIANIVSIPQEVDYNIPTTVTLVEGKAWEYIEFSVDDRGLQILEVQSGSGILYKISVTGFLAGENNLNVKEKARLSTLKLNAICLDNDGKKRYLGDLDIPMRFTFPKFDTQNDTKKGRKGTEVVLSGEMTYQPYFYQGAFTTLDSEGNEFPPTGDFTTLFNMITDDRVRLTALEATTDDHEDRITELETDSTTYAGQISALESGKENKSEKDTANGYLGLSSWKIKFRNLANTFTSFLQNTATSARTYTWPDKDITVAGLDDIANAIDSALQGLKNKDDVDAATTANITLSGTQTIDGIALIVGNRVLVKDQSDATQNGIYIVASGTWSRATDANVNTELQGAMVSVKQGTANADTTWRQTTDNITLGSSNIVWVQFGANVPDASPTTRGKSKLYNSLGTNTDGAVDQNTVKTNVDTLQNQINDNAADIAAVNPNLAPFQIYLYSNFT